MNAVGLGAVRKVFGRRGSQVVALGGVTIAFERGSFTAVMGLSGSGKSTLLNGAAGLVRPTSGSVELDGRELTDHPGGVGGQRRRLPEDVRSRQGC